MCNLQQDKIKYRFTRILYNGVRVSTGSQYTLQQGTSKYLFTRIIYDRVQKITGSHV
jgi:hypothetical protein